MKKRKLIATLLAFTLVAGSALTVHAEDAPGSTGSVTVSGNGTVDYVNTTIYEVTIPTSAALNLTVDPQGLAGLQNDQSATAEELSAYAGKITSTSKPVVINESSVEMKISVSMAVTGQATALSVTSGDAVNADDENNVWLYAIPSATAVTAEDGTGYTAASTAIVLTDTPTTVDFLLPAAEYEFVKDSDGDVTYERTETDAQGTGLTFAGLVNKNADWSTYADGTNKIGLTATFTFGVPGDSDVLGETPAAAFMMNYAGKTATVEAEEGGAEEEEPEGPSITAGATPVDGQAWDYETTFTKGTALTLNVANATVNGMTWGNSTSETATTSPKLTTTSSSATIAADMWAGAASGDVRYIKIQLSGGESFIIKVTVRV